MNLRVILDGDFDASVSADLCELADKLRERDLDVHTTKVKVAGVKVDLVVGIAVAGLAVASANLAVNIFNTWRGLKKPKYKITIGPKDGSPGSEDDMQKLESDLKAGNNVTVFLEKL